MVQADEPANREKLIFASIVFPSVSSKTNVILLVESIRTFAGSLSHAPIWLYTPDQGEKFSLGFIDKLKSLNVKLKSFEIDDETYEFPFTSHAEGAAYAESEALNKSDILVWLASNTLILQEPEAFLLRPEESLGFRPVHHTLIGSPYNEPLDPFWSLIYRLCEVSDDRIFSMTTHVDDTSIRPYLNSGILVTRPEKRILQAWRDIFLKVYNIEPLQTFYERDDRYRIFVHQALLSGVILSLLTREDMKELPRTYNYPLHLHDEDVTRERPSSLEELVTFRHEVFYQDPNWIEKMPAKSRLKKWISRKIG